MFVAAFLAGSFFPFSSEAVMLALLAAGLTAANSCFGVQRAIRLAHSSTTALGRWGKKDGWNDTPR